MRKLIPLVSLALVIGCPKNHLDEFPAPTRDVITDYIGPSYKTNDIVLSVEKHTAKDIGIDSRYSLINTMIGASDKIQMSSNTFRAYLALSYVEGCFDQTANKTACIIKAKLYFSGDSSALRTLNIVRPK